MYKYKADIVVKLKNGVRDPQGTAVDTILKRTNLEEQPNVQVGKYFSLSISGYTEQEARTKLEKICEDVLSNPVLESYEIERFAQI